MTLPPLATDEFGAAFRAVHGVPPFPWQARLAERLAAGEGWPSALHLPTGSGKTAAIDAALFHLALAAGNGPARQAPVRIAFVVDRRIIVDAAAERAKLIGEALLAAEASSVLGRMAGRLRLLAGPDAPPLMVRTLRGGLPREDDWAASPGQPTVLCTTVDQIGSRLLFRGYGVSDVMKPIHAGLLGADCLILLDEAHLSAPFLETLGRVGQYRAPGWCTEKPGPWGVVVLSATPRGVAPPFALEAEDRANPLLARRLGTSKPARLRALPPSTPDGHAAAFVAAVRQVLVAPARSVAVVVNRVALARAIFAALQAELRDTAQVELLTGRVRELDRDAIVPRIAAGLRDGEDAKPLVVVATQTIEAGADYDFDALVTQLAPIDALRQRFGRLNRTGRNIQAQAVIVAAKDEIAAKADDPVYGDRAKQTWDWLQTIATQPRSSARPEAGRRRTEADATAVVPAPAEPVLDFGIDALAVHLAHADLAALGTERARAPVLRPADVLLLSWTAPVPAVDPELAPFLHGLLAAPADVHLVWRADLALDADPKHLLALLDVAPPHARETLAVPLWTARAWLSGGAAADAADVEGAYGEAPRGEAGRAAFRWAGAESERTAKVTPADIRPGDVLVLPAAYGGCDEFGWAPAAREAVRDLGDAVAPGAPPRWWRRLHPALFEAAEWPEIAAAIADDDRSPRERDGAIRAALRLPEGARWDEVRPAGYDGVVLIFRRGTGDRAMDASTEGDAGLAAPAPVPLTRHVADVVGFAERFAHAAGLSAGRAADLRLAAELHDEGKRDPRFQIVLHGGDRLAAIGAAEPLGKSGEPPRRGANARAGLPERWRHEAQSVARAVHDPRLAKAADAELVLWLIGTHHGHGRPFFPHHDPREPEGLHGPQRLDFEFGGYDWTELHERLKARYGPWELARLEAVLRLADHRASAMEARG